MENLCSLSLSIFLKKTFDIYDSQKQARKLEFTCKGEKFVAHRQYLKELYRHDSPEIKQDMTLTNHTHPNNHSFCPNL